MANVSRPSAPPATRPPVAWADWALLACRLAVGAIFVLAGVAKLVNPGSFGAALIAYSILPVDLVRWVALIFPWIEVVVGAMLIVGLFTRFAAWSAIALLLMFCVVIGQALLRGLSLDDCGCFGGIVEAVPQLAIVLGGTSLGWQDVVRDLIYAAVALPVALRGSALFSIDAWQASRTA
jgi:uncharacterized membrane protein YphA (DoxX/SURF4 family)